MTRYLISIGAGLAAAIFFMVPLKGAVSAGLTMLVAPLPLMIGGLAFAPVAVVIGGAAGAALVAAFVHVYFAVFFLAWAAIPAWWLTRLAWLARPPASGEEAGPDGKVWYPVGWLAFWAAILGSGVAVLLVLVASWHFGSFGAFADIASRQLLVILEASMKGAGRPALPAEISLPDLARFLTLATPPILAGWATMIYCINLWLAGRLMTGTRQMLRPWQNIPESLRLPSIAAGIVAASLALSLPGGLTQMMAMIVLTAFATVYAIQGFAVLHSLTRNKPARGMLLGILYGASFILFPAPAVLAALFGLAFALGELARRRTPPPLNPKP